MPIPSVPYIYEVKVLSLTSNAMSFNVNFPLKLTEKGKIQGNIAWFKYHYSSTYLPHSPSLERCSVIWACFSWTWPVTSACMNLILGNKAVYCVLGPKYTHIYIYIFCHSPVTVYDELIISIGPIINKVPIIFCEWNFEQKSICMSHIEHCIPMFVENSIFSMTNISRSEWKQFLNFVHRIGTSLISFMKWNILIFVNTHQR